MHAECADEDIEHEASGMEGSKACSQSGSESSDEDSEEDSEEGSEHRERQSSAHGAEECGGESDHQERDTPEHVEQTSVSRQQAQPGPGGAHDAGGDTRFKLRPRHLRCPHHAPQHHYSSGPFVAQPVTGDAVCAAMRGTPYLVCYQSHAAACADTL